MRSARIWLFLLSVFCLVYPLTGWVNSVTAAEKKEKTVSATPATGEGKIQAQEGGKEEPQGDECPATFGPIITDTAIPIEKGRFALQPTFGLGFLTDSFTRSWRRAPTGGNRSFFAMDYKLTYGLLNNLEVFVVLPYLHNWVSNVGPRGRSEDFGGLGDINLTCKYRLVEEGPRVPTVTALFATDFPTGHFRHLNPARLGTEEIGGGAYVFTTGLNLQKYLKPFIFYGNLWYSMATDFTNDDGRQHPRDFVTINLAAEYPLTKKWVALLELTSFWDGGRLIGHQSNVAPAALLSVLPGIEYMATDKFSLALGVNIELAGKNTDAAVTPLLSMVYAF